MTIVGIYAWSVFWAIDEDKGSPSFYLSPKGFVDAGHRMVIVMPRGDRPAGPGAYRGIELERYGGAPHTIREDPTRGRIARTITRWSSYWRYVVAALVAGYRVSRRVRPDAIVAYGDYSVLPARVLALRFRIPMVTRLFGTNLADRLDRPLWLLYHHIHVLPFKVPADYVILCDDGSEGDRVAKRFGTPAERFRFWRNGGDHHAYDPEIDVGAVRRSLGLPEQGPVLFSISRLHPEKHIERVLAALEEVRAAHPDARFVIVGAGPDEARLRTEADRLGVADMIVWTGAVTRAELVRHIHAGDLFVAAGDRTNAANPLFESMLCARPGVVLATGGTAGVIAHGENGWLVPQAEPRRFGSFVLEALADREALARAGAAARAWALEHVPTYTERQRMEVALVEQAVREHRAGRRARRAASAAEDLSR